MGYPVSYYDLDLAYKTDAKNGTMRILHKLKDAHLHPNSFKKMSVKLAAQVH